MRISDWSSDVCSSDLGRTDVARHARRRAAVAPIDDPFDRHVVAGIERIEHHRIAFGNAAARFARYIERGGDIGHPDHELGFRARPARVGYAHDDGNLDIAVGGEPRKAAARSEAHTSELQSLMRNSYAVFCFKKQTKH